MAQLNSPSSLVFLVFVNTHSTFAFAHTGPYLEQSPLSLKISRSSFILWGLAQAHLLLEASLTTRELPSAEFLQCFYQWTYQLLKA